MAPAVWSERERLHAGLGGASPFRRRPRATSHGDRERRISSLRPQRRLCAVL